MPRIAHGDRQRMRPVPMPVSANTRDDATWIASIFSSLSTARGPSVDSTATRGGCSRRSAAHRRRRFGLMGKHLLYGTEQLQHFCRKFKLGQSKY